MKTEQNYSIKQFRIRASAAGRIMGGTVGLSESQEAEFIKLSERKSDPTQKPLTDKMEESLEKLQYAKDNPELPKGAKTYCEEWVKEQIYARRKEISTNTTEKGIKVEDFSLSFIAEQLGLGMLIKNEERFYNEYMEGEPDALPASCVIDAKSSWDPFTFPLFDEDIESAIYEWQGQTYMELTGRKKFILAYVLADTPIEIIEREARSYCWRNGLGELTDEILEKFIHHMTYPGIEPALKIKSFTMFYSSQKTKDLIERVKLCRVYINQLLDLLGIEPIIYE